jgi:urea-proton symporter
MIYILNVIEWVDEDEESMDEVLSSNLEEEGRRMLRSIMISKAARAYERIVKLSDPATKIVEMAEKLNVDMLVMRATGLSNHEKLGHVSSEVLKLTSIPILLMK